MKKRKLIAGNWKMNGDIAELDAIAAAALDHADVDVAIFPPFTLIAQAKGRQPGLGIGGQDCHAAPNGAHTGDVSAPMLAQAGASWVIVGHSERRADHGESDALVRAKAEAAIAAGLTPIVCVGETEAQRDAGEAVAVVQAQLAGSLPATGAFTVAYEPVWAIGTGRTPRNDDIVEMHAAIRAHVVDGARILYGGSVKPANAAEILALPNVDGALVGGASLKASDFVSIIEAAARAG